MFNEQSVGRRVVSKTAGIGTITEWDYNEHTASPVKVVFDNDSTNYEWFTSTGNFYGNSAESEDDITIYHIKQGSPDARRIVAMLALEYRSKRKLIRTITNYNPSHKYWAGAESQAFRMYDHAKELLTNGESNERI